MKTRRIMAMATALAMVLEPGIIPVTVALATDGRPAVTYDANAQEADPKQEAKTDGGSDEASEGETNATGSATDKGTATEEGESDLPQTGLVQDNTIPICMATVVCVIAGTEFLHMRRKLRE